MQNDRLVPKISNSLITQVCRDIVQGLLYKWTEHWILTRRT